MTKPNGGQAFPMPFVKDEDRDGYTEWVSATDVGFGGMTLRDWFAGQALARLVGLYDVEEIVDPDLPRLFAEASYRVADAMLAAREKE